jgi:hypothetical protein
MLTAHSCGWCEKLEQETLPDPKVRKALGDFVWVQAFTDRSLDEKFGDRRYPTVILVNPQTEKAFGRIVGYRPPGLFLRSLIISEKATGRSVPKELEGLAANIFTPDDKKLKQLAASGDIQGVVDYLQPVRNDELRECTYIALKIDTPPGVRPSDVECFSEGDYDVPHSGVLVCPVPVESKQVSIHLACLGFRAIDETISTEADKGLVRRDYRFQRLAAGEFTTFRGQRLFLGSWSNANVNKESQAILRVRVFNDDKSVKICALNHTTPPHWIGPTTLHLLGTTTRAAMKDYGLATWDYGFAIEHLIAHVEKDELIVESYTLFKDGRNGRIREVFKRSPEDQTPIPNP